MYNVKGPSKIVAKTTRRGISQNMDNIRGDHNRNKNINENDETVNGPKPVFQKKSSPSQHRQKEITPQHEEIINYINDSWNTVCSEVYSDTSSRSRYYEEPPSLILRDFKPFDLESWWGKRLFAYATGSVNGKVN